MHLAKHHALLSGVGGWWLPGVGLDLDFANNRTFNRTGNAVSTPAALLTTVRASAGSYFDRAGVLQQAANNAPRIDYDPVTLAALGVLAEEQRTNLLLRSAEFGNAAWTTSNSSISSDADVAPDGTTTADRLVENTSNTTHRVQQDVTKAASAITYTYSVFVKGTGRRLVVNAEDPGTGGVYAVFDIAGGQVGVAATAYGSGFVAVGARITSVGGSRYRCEVTLTSNTATTLRCILGLDNGTGTGALSQTYTGDGSAFLSIWGAQLEAGAFTTSYIPTVASQVTRAADAITLATSAFPFSDTAGTIVVAARLNPAFDTVNVCWNLDDGTINEVISFNVETSTVIQNFIYDGGALQANLDPNPGTMIGGVPFKNAMAWALNDIAAVLDGGTVATDASATLPTVTTLRIGKPSTASGWFNGHIKRLSYWNTRKSNAELQALST